MSLVVYRRVALGSFLLAGVVALAAPPARAQVAMQAGAAGPQGMAAKSYQLKQFAGCRAGRPDIGSLAGLSCFGYMSGNWAFSTAANISAGSQLNNASSMFAATLGVTGSSTGLIEGAVNDTSLSYDPVFTSQAGVSQLANTRFWLGVGGALTAVTFFSTLPGVTTPTAYVTAKFAAISYDSAVSANWQCCAGDGANYSCTGTGVAVTTGLHTLSVYVPQGQASPTVRCAIDNTVYTTATTTPNSSTFYAATPYITMTTLANSAATLLYGWNTLESY